jgi:hypothetical protein
MIKAIAAAALLAGAVTLVAAQPASADGVADMTCTTPSSNVLTSNPPLTNTTQIVTLTSQSSLGPCVSLSEPSVTSGSWTSVTPNVPIDCSGLLGANTGTHTVTWNTGQTSTLSGNRVSSIEGAALVVTFTGTVTSGLFAGDTVVEQFVGPSTNITLCELGLGTVSSIYSTMEFELTSV